MRSDRRHAARHYGAGLIAVALGLLLLACQPRMERATVEVGGVPFTVEVARTDAERTRGLMHRRSLGPREGMLFIFDRDQHLDFWMKDTTIPLSIAFLSAEGRILEIMDLRPLSLEVVRSRFSSRYALEVSQGAFAEVGAGVGDLVSLPPGAR